MTSNHQVKYRIKEWLQFINKESFVGTVHFFYCFKSLICYLLYRYYSVGEHCFFFCCIFSFVYLGITWYKYLIYNITSLSKLRLWVPNPHIAGAFNSILCWQYLQVLLIKVSSSIRLFPHPSRMKLAPSI